MEKVNYMKNLFYFTLFLHFIVPAVYNFMLAFRKDSAPPTFRTLLKGHSCKAQLYIKYVLTSKSFHTLILF
jgi:hypothetical protein